MAMITTPGPDFNGLRNKPILLIGCLVILAAFCGFYELYKVIEYAAAINSPSPHPHGDVTLAFREGNLWLFALLGYGGLVALVLVAFYGLYRLWRGEASLFQSVFDAMHEAVAITDQRGRLVYINAALCQMLDIARNGADIRFYGCDWRYLFSRQGVAVMDADIIPVLEKNSYWCNEITLYRRDDSPLPVVLSLTKLPEGGMIATLRDISARKGVESENDELRQQVYQVQKLEALGRLAGGIAHDFNNVLAAIMGYAEFLVEDLDPDTSQHRFARGIMQSGTQALNLIEQILTFSQRSEAPRRVLDVATVMHETLDMLESGLPKTIDIRTQITPDNVYVHAGHVQLVQLFMNVLINARDAVDNRNGEITVTLDKLDHGDDFFADMLVTQPAESSETGKPDIAIQRPDAERTRLLLGRIARDDNYVHVTVQDNGHGMPQTVMERIFDPFFTTKDSESGTGLGMLIIHGIISGLAAGLAIDSIEGAGTRIDIFLPACDAPAEDGETYSPMVDEDRLRDHLNGEIVVIDDDDNVRIMLGHMLERRNIPVTSFSNPQEALAYIHVHGRGIACVITDYNMPEITGLDVIEELEEEYPTLPFVIVTGYNSEDLIYAMRNYPGLRAILHKPLQTQEIMAALQRVVLTAPGDAL